MRINLLYKLDNLLEACQPCDKRKYSGASPEVTCKGCQIYSEIRGIGENLGRKKDMALNITVEEFVQLNNEGKSRSEICQLKGIKPNALSNWKWINKEKINAHLSKAQPPSKEVKPSEAKNTQEDKTAEYERVISVLKSDLNNLIHDNKGLGELIDDLQAKVKELENIDAACEDVESETSSLRDENAALVKQGHHDSYIISNQKYQLKQYEMEMEALEEENKALKYFARKYLS